VVLAVAVVVVGVTVLAGRDDAGVHAAPSGPGALQPDRGARHLAAGQHAAPRAGGLPTSGPHHVVAVHADRRALSDDELLTALEAGDVVLTYSGARPDPALVRVQRDVAGRFDASVAAAGQAVLLARHPGPTTALAWRRVLRASSPGDPAVATFADAWLGRGAGT
jgi:hypothetical protein